MPFQPGQSGNPGGRPRELGDLRELARTYTTLAIETLVDIASNEEAKEAARVMAANAILDRGYGKPTQPTELSGPGGGPVQVEEAPITDEQRARALAALLARAQAQKAAEE